MHAGKWNGLGGKLLPGETPEACVIREVEEESGLRLVRPELRGLITFPKFSRGEDWYTFVFVARFYMGELIDSPEGVLRWINDARLPELNLWEGDRVFLPWLDEPGFFSARFDYEDGCYVGHEVTFYGRSLAPVTSGDRTGVAPAPVDGDHAEACWLCGGPVYKLHCKITCRVCGFRRDCSDP